MQNDSGLIDGYVSMSIHNRPLLTGKRNQQVEYLIKMLDETDHGIRNLGQQKSERPTPLEVLLQMGEPIVPRYSLTTAIIALQLGIVGTGTHHGRQPSARLSPLPILPSVPTGHSYLASFQPRALSFVGRLRRAPTDGHNSQKR
jgi:hypothetical protein